MAKKARAETTEATPISAEVKELPKSLAGPLTVREKRAHLKRRDELLKLHNSAARLAPHEQNHAHAIVRSHEYRVELNRLIALRPLPFKERHVTKPELERVIKATAHNLSDALLDQGLLAEAYGVLAVHDRKSKKGEPLVALGRAIARADDDHCQCPPEDKHVRRIVFVPARQEYLEELVCMCGHVNVTSTPPADVIALRQAPSAFSERVPDDHLTAQARRVK